MSDNRKKQALVKQREQAKEIVEYLIDSYCRAMTAKKLRVDKERLLLQAFDLIETDPEGLLGEYSANAFNDDS